MILNVFVQGRAVATLSTPNNGFNYELQYLPNVAPGDFVSLQMPVRNPPWVWPGLHPFFQVSMPEGYLLSVLKEQLGPLLGATPLELLSVVGHNMVGRVQLGAGASPTAAAAMADLQGLLHGQDSAGAFFASMGEYASSSGVSGVVPKFLTPQAQALFRKGTVPTKSHIVKASSQRQPFVALNEHLCMQVARSTGFDTAYTEVSDDGQVLVVERFDIDPDSGQRLGFEDFCSLQGMQPDEKYNSTWERAANLVRDWVEPNLRRHANEQLAVTLLLSYALGNADCHTKNLGFIYNTLQDVRMAPIYDMLTITAYDQYAANPPGMSVGGKKSWDSQKSTWMYLQQFLGIEPARQRQIADQVASAISAAVPDLIHRTNHTPGFEEVGSRMLWQWQAGLKRLSDRTSVAVPDIAALCQSAGQARPTPAVKFADPRIGESPLLAPRKRARPTRPS